MDTILWIALAGTLIAFFLYLLKYKEAQMDKGLKHYEEHRDRLVYKKREMPKGEEPEEGEEEEEYTPIRGARLTRAIGQMIGFCLTLYVFDQVINAVMVESVNSTYFSESAKMLITVIFPIIFIFGAFSIIHSALRGGGLI